MRVVFATGNKNKVREASAILEGVEIISMKEIGLDPDIDENGTTYAENAAIKARCVRDVLPSDYADCAVIADDSGFEVDYLNREPGIYSARFMGEDTSYVIKNQAILDKLKGVPDEQRTARFCCAIVCILPDGRELTSFATYEGSVAYEAKGTNGFGYDPIFMVPGYNKTDAELEPEVKNTIGHRGKALRDMKNKLEALNV